MSKLKKHCEKNEIEHLDLEDGGIAIDIGKLSKEQLEELKRVFIKPTYGIKFENPKQDEDRSGNRL